MELFFMRHAEAESRDLYADDRQRPLTPLGHQQHQRVVRALKSLLQPLDHLLTSPVLRARQTAEIVAATVSCATAVQETSVLAEACTVDAVLQLLQGYPHQARLLCVGHEPHMSKLSAVLLDGEGHSAIAFQVGSLLALTFSDYPIPGQGTLRFFLRPADVLLLGSTSST
jgi:phosphohistidine phosphatase